jgi:hypothetical protein
MKETRQRRRAGVVVLLQAIAQRGKQKSGVCLTPTARDAEPHSVPAHALGIITLEDVIEEILQEEILDEHDRSREELERRRQRGAKQVGRGGEGREEGRVSTGVGTRTRRTETRSEGWRGLVLLIVSDAFRLSPLSQLDPVGLAPAQGGQGPARPPRFPPSRRPPGLLLLGGLRRRLGRQRGLPSLLCLLHPAASAGRLDPALHGRRRAWGEEQGWQAAGGGGGRRRASATEAPLDPLDLSAPPGRDDVHLHVAPLLPLLCLPGRAPSVVHPEPGRLRFAR